MQVPLHQLLFALSKGLDFVEQELLGVTSNHGKRTAYVSARICRAMGLPDSDVFDMACCAVLHDNALTQYMLDVGPEGYTRLENFESHCVRGEENASAFPFAGDVAGIVLHHHENWDGSGFHGLRDVEIPLRAAVLRLADNLDLCLRMGTGRASLIDEIREHAMEHRGSLYSPDAVDTLLDIVDEDFIHCLADKRIDVSLKQVVPAIEVHLTSRQMLRLCNLFALIIDAKSPFTKNHSTGVANLVSRLSCRYGFDEDHRYKLMIAAYLHDVGKLSIPLTILEKPGPLTEGEFEIMRNHALFTRSILQEVNGLGEITTWSSCHHEKLNGRGYPDAFTKDELCFECRLLACCDIYQALTEDRPYRLGLSHEQSMGIMWEMVENGEIDASIVNDIEEEFGGRTPKADQKDAAFAGPHKACA